MNTCRIKIHINFSKKVSFYFSGGSIEINSEQATLLKIINSLLKSIDLITWEVFAQKTFSQILSN